MPGGPIPKPAQSSAPMPSRSIAPTLARRRTCRSSPLKLAVAKAATQLARDLRADHPGAERQHVDVIVLDALAGRVGVVGHRAADAVDLRSRDGDPRSRPAAEDATLGIATDDRAGHRQRPVGIVVRGLIVVGCRGRSARGRPRGSPRRRPRAGRPRRGRIRRRSSPVRVHQRSGPLSHRFRGEAKVLGDHPSGRRGAEVVDADAVAPIADPAVPALARAGLDRQAEATLGGMISSR